VLDIVRLKFLGELEPS